MAQGSSWGVTAPVCIGYRCWYSSTREPHMSLPQGQVYFQPLSTGGVFVSCWSRVLHPPGPKPIHKLKVPFVKASQILGHDIPPGPIEWDTAFAKVWRIYNLHQSIIINLQCKVPLYLAKVDVCLPNKNPVPKDQTLQVGLSSMWEPGLVHVYLGIDQDYLFALPIFWQFLGHDCMYVYIYMCVCVCFSDIHAVLHSCLRRHSYLTAFSLKKGHTCSLQSAHCFCWGILRCRHGLQKVLLAKPEKDMFWMLQSVFFPQ